MTVKPWHQLCMLRDDVRTGKMTLAEFAADLNGVRTGEAPPIYREPGMFFARTYPTYRIKQLARDVLLRLAGQGGKPVLQLQVAYGGGKTHTLIALLHLAERGDQFAAGDSPESNTMRELLTFAGLSKSPPARVALLPFDQFDVLEGLEVYGPNGTTRRVKTPWGALAYQLAGDVGYARLLSHDEGFTVPAEPLLVDLLKAPLKDGLGSLVLVDEAVWYYRELVLHNQRMFGVMKDFYQVLTQAVAKVPRTALVASLIASRVEANDQTGVQCLQALEEIFGRIAEPVEPVAREDVAEILRRRLFERVAGEEERRPAVDAMMAAMQRLPLRDAQCDEASYDRLLESYPFHPDLIDVLYQKWTQMSGFQRTRGALRLLAYALRESEGRDPAPLVGPGAFLPSGGENGLQDKKGLSAALGELVKICTERERWTPILNGELEKARQVQARLPTL
ncbi:MAG: ATP-binding protein, partial [Anaerolineales bacterium]|nr:ATP-binding protein [Anaerolineales bacterium]